MTVKCGDGVAPAKNPILIKHLFTMTAGFSYKLDSPQILLCKEETDGRCGTRELMRYLSKEPLLFEPGERWEYSLCHDVLAALVEVISGVTFGEYVKKNIFDPLGMNDSTFLLDDSRLDEIVDQYRYKEGEGVGKCDKTIAYKLGREYESGGAGCISTVDDYMKLIEALRVGDVILKRDTIELLATDQMDGVDMKAYYVVGYGYGLGIRTPDASGKRTDFGWNGAAGAFGAVDLKNEITLYYSQAVLTSPARPLQSSYIEAAKLDLGFEAYEEEMWKEKLNSLTGIY
jgi:CubicO group peptidase (beta-lactamase class C family)